jgi:Fe-Mn family superoxide dismutase
MTHSIQPPQFALNALEPYFDAATMDLHVHKHHQGYADKLNAALENTPELQSKPLEDLVSLSADHNPLITNMAGGVLNHNFFWSILSPQFDQPVPDSFKPFIEPFTQAATTLFGSGWTWLVKTSTGIEVINTPNQDSPLAQGKTPLLALDVWEHSYYLKYQNRRPEYINAFWHLVNWEHVQTLY